MTTACVKGMQWHWQEQPSRVEKEPWGAVAGIEGEGGVTRQVIRSEAGVHRAVVDKEDGFGQFRDRTLRGWGRALRPRAGERHKSRNTKHEKAGCNPRQAPQPRGKYAQQPAGSRCRLRLPRALREPSNQKERGRLASRLWFGPGCMRRVASVKWLLAPRLLICCIAHNGPRSPSPSVPPFSKINGDPTNLQVMRLRIRGTPKNGLARSAGSWAGAVRARAALRRRRHAPPRNRNDRHL